MCHPYIYFGHHTCDVCEALLVLRIATPTGKPDYGTSEESFLSNALQVRVQGMPENASCVFLRLIACFVPGKNCVFFLHFFLRLNATLFFFDPEISPKRHVVIFVSFQKPIIAYFMQRSRFYDEKVVNLPFLCLFVFLRLFAFICVYL
jgi:hypothetical protein